MSTKKDRDERKEIAKAIATRPTASDAQIAAEAETTRELVTDVRAEMGPKHTWPKAKEDR